MFPKCLGTNKKNNNLLTSFLYNNHISRLECDCDLKGTETALCNKFATTCLCKKGFDGPRCDRCAIGYAGLPICFPIGKVFLAGNSNFYLLYHHVMSSEKRGKKGQSHPSEVLFLII